MTPARRMRDGFLPPASCRRTQEKEKYMKFGRSIALTIIAGSIALAIIAPHRTIKSANAASSADARTDAIESALYARTEFFGAEALVPFPTAEARTRLAELQRQYPNAAEIVLKLAKPDEKDRKTFGKG